MRTRTMIIMIAATLTLTACGTTTNTTDTATPEQTTRERLEAQGIVYSDDDWDTTVRRVCSEKYPGIYMGVDGAIEQHRGSMTQEERMDYVLEAGAAPNSAGMSSQEKQAVLDLVLDNEC